MPDYLMWDVTVRTYTPLHVGSGEKLLQDYDFKIHAGRTWRLNLDALFDEKIPDEAMARRAASRPPGELLSAGDFREGSPIFRYVLAGQPRSSQTGAEVREQIKDVWDRPYLPGSSLKGALRTAILWSIVRQSGRTITLRDLNAGGGFAAQPVERDALRQRGQRLANYDLLRALQVSDSEPLDASALMLANASVVGGQTRQGQPGAPIELEAIRPNVTLRARVKLDTALFGAWARRGDLDLGDKRDWLERLPLWVQAHSQDLAARALAWCQRKAQNQRLMQFYRQIQQPRAEDSCFLQIGWGGGWDSKTLGSLLQKDPAAFEEIAAQFRLRRGAKGGVARAGAPFPATKRLVVGARNPQALAPLGWALLTFERRA